MKCGDCPNVIKQYAKTGNKYFCKRVNDLIEVNSDDTNILHGCGTKTEILELLVTELKSELEYMHQVVNNYNKY